MTRPDSVAPPAGSTRRARPDRSTASSARVVMTSGDVSRALRRVAHEILERNKGADGLVVLGIPTRGVALARRLVQVMAEVEGVTSRSGPSTSRCTATTCAGSRSARSSTPTSRRPASTTAPSCSSTTCCSPGAPCAPRWTRSPTSAVRAPCGWPSWSTGATATCRSAPTTSARTCPPPAASGCKVLLSRARRRGRGPHQRGEPLMRHLLVDGGPRHRRDPRALLTDRPSRCTTCSGARSRSCRRCAGAPSSTCSSRTPPAPAPPSRSPASGSRPTSSTSRGKGSSTSKGESLRDTVLTVAAMGVDGLVIRHHASGAARQV